MEQGMKTPCFGTHLRERLFDSLCAYPGGLFMAKIIFLLTRADKTAVLRDCSRPVHQEIRRLFRLPVPPSPALPRICFPHVRNHFHPATPVPLSPSRQRNRPAALLIRTRFRPVPARSHFRPVIPAHPLLGRLRRPESQVPPVRQVPQVREVRRDPRVLRGLPA